jgi:glycerol-3-phosphate dehydrogenase (NAD(P)+)
MTERRPLQTIGVVGAGAWGSALANVAARAGRAVRLWARDPSHVEEMIAAREYARRLPGVPLEPAIRPTADMSDLAQADAILLVAPAQALRVVTVALAEFVGPDTPLVICAKGFERASGAFLSAVVNEAAPGRPVAALSGPSFADDVARGLPTAVTIAAEDDGLAQALCTALSSPAFRLYHSTDLRGVEIGGAAKNVLAIAVGAAAGLGLGASAQAALVARGFSELRRFGRAWGAREETLMGLSGLGDLVLTCSSIQSRNFALGFALGRGEPPGTKLAEGAFTASALVAMARQRGVEMPISDAVASVLDGRASLNEAVDTLLARPRRPEG